MAIKKMFTDNLEAWSLTPTIEDRELSFEMWNKSGTDVIKIIFSPEDSEELIMELYRLRKENKK